MERTPNKSQYTKLTLEKKILPPSCRDSNSQSFDHEPGALNQLAILAAGYYLLTYSVVDVVHVLVIAAAAAAAAASISTIIVVVISSGSSSSIVDIVIVILSLFCYSNCVPLTVFDLPEETLST